MKDPDHPEETPETRAAKKIAKIARRLRIFSWTLHHYADVLKNHDALGYEGSAAMDAVIKLEGVADDLAKLPAKIDYHLANPPTRWDCTPGEK